VKQLKLLEKENGLYTFSFRSSLLGTMRHFQILLPDQLSNKTPVHVIYVLHGAGCDHTVWTTHTKIIAHAECKNIALVFPEGGAYSWYLDSPIRKSWKTESWLMQELIPLVEALFPIGQCRDRRHMMGASMGGHGAMTLAEKYPDFFESVSSIFGILKLTLHRREESRVSQVLGDWEDFPERWKANCAWELAPSFLQNPIRILFDCGSSDTETGAIECNREFHRRLKELGIAHDWIENPGGHNSLYINEQLERHLAFHLKHV